LPEELLPVLKMLMDEKNTYMNGEFIKVNGGWLC
jgi:NAD(P)-dependent dehydrogenase (short-subunit alcohol dehydrogenase family)